MALFAVASGVDSAAQFFTVLLAFVFVLALTVWGTKFLGNFQKAQNFSRNFESVEVYKLSSGTYLQLVKIGGSYYVLAVGKESVTLIDRIDKEQLVLDEDDDGSERSGGFTELLKKAGNKLQNRGGDK